MSHTPGPWAVHYDNENVTVYRKAFRKDLGSIAVITSFDDVDDARLIAAAPYLLSCLEEMRDLMLERGVAVSNEHRDRITLQNAMLAIAEAKGKA